MKKRAYGIYVFLIGLFIVALEWKVGTATSYGFEFGVNEGMRKGMSTFFLEELIGDGFMVDIFFNPLGYLLMLMGLSFITKAGKHIKNVRISVVIGLAASIVKLILPFAVSQYSLLKPVVLCVVIEFAALMAILYSFSIACKQQVDDFNDMEVRKDLLFATELYGVATLMSFLLLPLKALYIYFAKGAYIITIVLAAATMIYYCIKAAYYTNKMKLFQKNDGKTLEQNGGNCNGN